MSEEPHENRTRRWGNSRALSSASAAIILVVVVIIGGVGTFAAFNSLSNKVVCAPAGSAQCLVGTNIHDLSILAPIRTALQGATIPFTLIFPSGETSTAFSFDFGDGSSVANPGTTTVDHAYTNPGTFFVSVTAKINGAAHDNYHSLTKVSVATSYASDSAGIYPTTVGSVLSNTTTNQGATSVIGVGGKVTVAGSYTLAPTNPAYSLGAPSITNSAGVTGTVTATATSATGTFTFPSSGIFTITFVGFGSSATATPAKAYQNYTWTVAVAPSGTNYGIQGIAAISSPHRGQVIAYEAVPGGAKSFDPANTYDVYGGEVIQNSFEPLIAYNGSNAGPDPNDFVPVLATCVPGSSLCTSLYGNTLVQGSNYTFVISHSAQFYDHSTGAHWGVYPSDAMFSMVRVLGFSLYPSVAVTAGWITAQALLSQGSFTWDGGLHGLWNNTPSHMYASMSVNDSTWCPAAAMSAEHGCITFHASGANLFGGPAWTFFLELIGDEPDGEITPAGWYSATAQGQAIPGWTDSAAYQGDHPVLLPGGATSTTSAAFTAAVAAMSPTALDAWETGWINPITNAYAGNTQWSTVGSGPYYLAGTQIHINYELKANPYWAANPNCLASVCFPAPGKYAADVQVTWEATPTTGEQALASGVADFASIPAGDTALLLQLTQLGRVGSLVVPTIDTFNIFFDLNFDVAREHTYTSAQINIPHDFFANLGLRQFLIYSYPYGQIQSTINTKDGIQYNFDYGGAIPEFLGNYYPKDIPWAIGNPDTNPADVGGAAWWWKQITTPTSPMYDPELASCTSSSPCSYPLYGGLGSPDEDQRLTDYITSVSSLTSGAIKMSLVDIAFFQTLNEFFAPPGGSAFTMLGDLGWLPDYPDPTDYIVPYYLPGGFFNYAGGLQPVLDTFNSTSCATSASSYQSTVASSFVTQGCQGAAYDAMVSLLLKAGALNPGPVRVSLYDQAEHIAFQLGIMVDEVQSNNVFTYAAWIDPTTLNANILLGGGGINPWYTVGGNNVV